MKVKVNVSVEFDVKEDWYEDGEFTPEIVREVELDNLKNDPLSYLGMVLTEEDDENITLDVEVSE